MLLFSHYPRFGLFRGCFKNLEEWWFGVRGEEASEEAERAALVGHIWRQLAFTAVQQQSKLLLDRLQPLGDGATEVEVERRAARERKAQAVCLRQGRAVMTGESARGNSVPPQIF